MALTALVGALEL
jgi:hypothetical protein